MTWPARQVLILPALLALLPSCSSTSLLTKKLEAGPKRLGGVSSLLGAIDRSPSCEKSDYWVALRRWPPEVFERLIERHPPSHDDAVEMLQRLYHVAGWHVDHLEVLSRTVKHLRPAETLVSTCKPPVTILQKKLYNVSHYGALPEQFVPAVNLLVELGLDISYHVDGYMGTIDLYCQAYNDDKAKAEGLRHLISLGAPCNKDSPRHLLTFEHNSGSDDDRRHRSLLYNGDGRYTIEMLEMLLAAGGRRALLADYVGDGAIGSSAGLGVATYLLRNGLYDSSKLDRALRGILLSGRPTLAWKNLALEALARRIKSGAPTRLDSLVGECLAAWDTPADSPDEDWLETTDYYFDVLDALMDLCAAPTAIANRYLANPGNGVALPYFAVSFPGQVKTRNLCSQAGQTSEAWLPFYALRAICLGKVPLAAQELKELDSIWQAEVRRRERNVRKRPKTVTEFKPDRRYTTAKGAVMVEGYKMTTTNRRRIVAEHELNRAEAALELVARVRRALGK